MPGFGGMQIDIRYVAAALGLPGRQPCHDICEVIRGMLSDGSDKQRSKWRSQT